MVNEAGTPSSAMEMNGTGRTVMFRTTAKEQILLGTKLRWMTQAHWNQFDHETSILIVVYLVAHFTCKKYFQ